MEGLEVRSAYLQDSSVSRLFDWTNSMRLVQFLPSVLLIGLVTTVSFAGEHDWPQWRGPERDGHAAPQPLLSLWPEGGPKLKWSVDTLGLGYSSQAVADSRVFTMGADQEQCFVVCLDVNSGSTLWRTPISRASTKDDYLHGWGGGPRSTPTVDGKNVYALSDLGTVACLSTEDGSIRWKVDLLEFPDASVPKWGFSESVLIDGNRAVVTPGGKNLVVALDKNSGEVLWNSEGISEGAQYVSVMQGTFNDVPFYTTASASGLHIFHAESGEKLFHTPESGNRTAVIPTPIIDLPFVYHTSDYGAGNVLVKLSGRPGTLQAETVYHLDNKSMQNHHGGVVLVDGVIYGFTKADGGQWMAQDLESGETLWMHKIRGARSGSISYADGHLYCYNDGDGSLHLVKPSRQGWEETGRLVLPKQTSFERGSGAIWAHPIVARQTLLIRDQELLFAYDIAK